MALDIRPFSLCDRHTVWPILRILFNSGQSVLVDVKVDPKPYFVGKKLSEELKAISQYMRKEFLAEMAMWFTKNSGAVFVDGVHLKMNGNHFHDFTLHYIYYKDGFKYRKPTLRQENNTLLLIECPDVSNASNIWQTIELSLQEVRGFTGPISKKYTMVTDNAATMAKIENS